MHVCLSTWVFVRGGLLAGMFLGVEGRRLVLEKDAVGKSTKSREGST